MSVEGFVFFTLAPIFLIVLRARIRHNLGLSPMDCGDCFCVWFCWPCTVCQDARHVDRCLKPGGAYVGPPVVIGAAVAAPVATPAVTVTPANTAPVDSVASVMVKCTGCGAGMTSDAKFCCECGATVSKPQAKFCASCGTQNDKGKFCMSCGAQLALG